jgi:hypothetical protein
MVKGVDGGRVRYGQPRTDFSGRNVRKQFRISILSKIDVLILNDLGVLKGGIP